MIERGTVVELKDDQAVIRFERKSTCDKCGMCSFSPNDMHIDMTVVNSLNAEVKDEVEVDISNGLVLKMSLIVYMLPLLIAGIALGIGFMLQLLEWITFIMFFSLLGVGYLFVYFIDKRYAKNLKAKPILVNIINKDDEPTENDIIGE